jgi:hypothetical protein
VVATAKEAQVFLEQTKINLGKHSRKSTMKALETLRTATKGYVAFIPGAGLFVDHAFDSVDSIVDKHAEEANDIIYKAYLELMDVLKEQNFAVNMGTSLEVLGVLRRLLRRLQMLGVKAGGDVVSPVLGNTLDGLKEKFSLDEVRRVGSGGMEALGKIQPQVS